jgi:hypothetical protein
MNTDPATNVVVFLLRRGDGQPVVADGPTLADDCVRRAWATVSQQHRAASDEVAAVHSEWQPAPADLVFIQQTFPAARLTYNFARPGPHGWEAAFAEAHRVMAQAQGERQRDQMSDQAAESMRHVADHGELLPVLVSASSPRRHLLEYLPHQELVPGRLFVTLATVAPTPRGTIGMNHLTHAELGQRSFADLMAAAAATLTTGLRIDGHADEAHPERGSLLAVRRDGPFAASALALPGFAERMAGLVGDADLVVGLPEPDLLLVAGARSGWVEDVHRAVVTSPCPTSELVPTVLALQPSGVRVLAERPEPGA